MSEEELKKCFKNLHIPSAKATYSEMLVQAQKQCNLPKWDKQDPISSNIMKLSIQIEKLKKNLKLSASKLEKRSNLEPRQIKNLELIAEYYRTQAAKLTEIVEELKYYQNEYRAKFEN